MLTFAARGEGPFGRGDTVAVLYRIVHGQPNLDGIPGALQWLIGQCLARDPRERPTSAGFLASLTAAYPAAADPAIWQTWRELEVPGQDDPGTGTGAGQQLSTGPSAPFTMTASAHAAPTPPSLAGPSYTPPAGPAHQAPIPAQAPPPMPAPAPSAPQQQQHDQYRQPALQPRPPARRLVPWWPWAAGGAAALVAVVVVLVAALGGSPGTPAASGHDSHTPPAASSPAAAPLSTSSSPASFRSSPPAQRSSSPAPSRRPVTHPAAPVLLSQGQLRVGDCLTGSNLPLGTDNSWPAQVSAVPCTERHTGEVFFADDSYWSASLGYPGDNGVNNQATTECDNAYAAYDGIPDADSNYTWDSIDPSSTDWQNGMRELICVAYDATNSQPSGAPLYASIKGTRR